MNADRPDPPASHHLSSIPHPICLLFQIPNCENCDLKIDARNPGREPSLCGTLETDPQAAVGFNADTSTFLIAAGDVTHDNSVYKIGPGICTERGGTWFSAPSPGGCAIPAVLLLSTKSYAPRAARTATSDDLVSRAEVGELNAAAGDMPARKAFLREGRSVDDVENEHLVSDLGLLALLVVAVAVIGWLFTSINGVDKRRRAKRRQVKRSRSPGVDYEGHDRKNDGLVDGNGDGELIDRVPLQGEGEADCV